MGRRDFLKASLAAGALMGLPKKIMAQEPVHSDYIDEAAGSYASVAKRPLEQVLRDYHKIYAVKTSDGEIGRRFLPQGELEEESRKLGYDSPLTEAHLMLRVAQDKQGIDALIKVVDSESEDSVETIDDVRRFMHGCKTILKEVTEASDEVERRITSTHPKTPVEKARLVRNVMFDGNRPFELIDDDAKAEWLNVDTNSIAMQHPLLRSFAMGEYYNPSFAEVWKRHQGVCEDFVGVSSVINDELRRRGHDMPMAPITIPSHTLQVVGKPGARLEDSWFMEMTRRGELFDYNQYNAVMNRNFGIGLDELPPGSRKPRPFAALTNELFNHAAKILTGYDTDATSGRHAKKYLDYCRAFTSDESGSYVFSSMANSLQAGGIFACTIDCDYEDGSIRSIDSKKEDLSVKLREIGVITSDEKVTRIDRAGEGHGPRIHTGNRVFGLERTKIHDEDCVKLVQEGVGGAETLLRVEETGSHNRFKLYQRLEDEPRIGFLNTALGEVNNVLAVDPDDSLYLSVKAALYYDRAKLYDKKETREWAMNEGAKLNVQAFVKRIEEKPRDVSWQELGRLNRQYYTLYELSGNENYLRESLKYMKLDIPNGDGLYKNLSPYARETSCKIRLSLNEKLLEHTDDPTEKTGIIGEIDRTYGELLDITRHELDPEKRMVGETGIHLGRCQFQIENGLPEAQAHLRNAVISYDFTRYGNYDEAVEGLTKLTSMSDSGYGSGSSEIKYEILQPLVELGKQPGLVDSFNQALADSKALKAQPVKVGLKTYEQAMGKTDEAGNVTGIMSLEEMVSAVEDGAINRGSISPLHALIRVAQDHAEKTPGFNPQAFTTRADNTIGIAENVAQTVAENIQGQERPKGCWGQIEGVHNVLFDAEGLDKGFTVNMDDRNRNPGTRVFETWENMHGDGYDFAGVFNTVANAQPEPIECRPIVLVGRVIIGVGEGYIDCNEGIKTNEKWERSQPYNLNSLVGHLDEVGIADAMTMNMFRSDPNAVVASSLCQLGIRSMMVDNPTRQGLDEAIRYLRLSDRVCKNPETLGALGKALLMRAEKLPIGERTEELLVARDVLSESVGIDGLNKVRRQALARANIELYKLEGDRDHQIEYLRNASRQYVDAVKGGNRVDWMAEEVPNSRLTTEGNAVSKKLIEIDPDPTAHQRRKKIFEYRLRSSTN